MADVLTFPDKIRRQGYRWSDNDLYMFICGLKAAQIYSARPSYVSHNLLVEYCVSDENDDSLIISTTVDQCYMHNRFRRDHDLVTVPFALFETRQTGPHTTVCKYYQPTVQRYYGQSLRDCQKQRRQWVRGKKTNSYITQIIADHHVGDRDWMVRQIRNNHQTVLLSDLSDDSRVFQFWDTDFLRSLISDVGATANG